MRYYFIKNNKDPKVTGVRSGTSQSRIILDIFSDNPSLKDFLFGDNSSLRRGDFPKEDFKLEGLPFEKKGKFNDFVSVGGVLNGFFINEKVKVILDTCKLPPYKYYKVSFDRKGEIIEGYYWLYFNLFDGKTYINYNLTLFDTEREERELGHKVKIRCYEDYIELSKQMGRGIRVEKIVFDHSFDTEIDLFGMRFFGNRNYISERLKKKFEDNNVVGYELRYPLSDPEVEWE